MPLEMAQTVQTCAAASLTGYRTMLCTLQLALFLVGAAGWEYAAQTLRLDPESIHNGPICKVGLYCSRGLCIWRLQASILCCQHGIICISAKQVLILLHMSCSWSNGRVNIDLTKTDQKCPHPVSASTLSASQTRFQPGFALNPGNVHTSHKQTTCHCQAPCWSYPNHGSRTSVTSSIKRMV